MTANPANNSGAGDIEAKPMQARILLVPLLLATLLPCASAAPPAERKERIEAVAAGATPDALARKARSEVRLRHEGVPINESLPAIEDLKEIERRSKEEIAWRAMALLVVAAKGEGVDQSQVDGMIDEYGLAAHFTPKERAFIVDASPSDEDRVQFVWRYEAAWTLLWALGYVETLEKPTDACDAARAVKWLHDRGAARFIADAKLRPIEEIADAADLIYRYHWAVVDARVNGDPEPASLSADVTMERHYALNWLVGYMDEAWDDISTDT